MFETYSTVIGTVITHPRRRFTQSGEEVISFRVASTVRYKVTGAANWQDGSTLYLTVSCWRRLVTGVGAAIGKGSPVIVHGQLSSSQYTAKDGTARSDLEMRAIAIGPDLARCICRIERNAKVGPTADAEAAAAAEPTASQPADSQSSVAGEVGQDAGGLDPTVSGYGTEPDDAPASDDELESTSA